MLNYNFSVLKCYKYAWRCNENKTSNRGINIQEIPTEYEFIWAAVFGGNWNSVGLQKADDLSIRKRIAVFQWLFNNIYVHNEIMTFSKYILQDWVK